MIQLRVNGEEKTLDVDPEMPLLWAIRETLGMTGTKFGCGIARCGACTVHLNGYPIRSCVTPVAAAEGGDLLTIEGLAQTAVGGGLHPLQQAWIDRQVPQCGYCQSGQLMSAAALLAGNPTPDDGAIDAAMSGNLCRCGMYGRIRDAIKLAAEHSAAAPTVGGVEAYDPATAGEEWLRG